MKTDNETKCISEPARSANQTPNLEPQSIPLPELHRIKGEFSLMNSETKELFPLSHAVIDELCRRSNQSASLKARVQRLEDVLRKAEKYHADRELGHNSKELLSDIRQALSS